MKWMPTRVLLMWLSAGLLAGLAGCGESNPKTTAGPDNNKNGKPAGDNEPEAKNQGSQGLSSPKETIKSITQADAERDYAKFGSYFTEDAERALAGGLLMSAKFLVAIINNNDPEKTSEQDRSVVTAVDALLKKHGLDKNLDIKADFKPAEEQAVLTKVGEQIAKPGEFITDFITTMRANGQNPDSRIFEDDAHLENLKIENTEAQAELVFTRDGQELRRPIGFENVAGQWRISKIPDVLFK